MCKLSRYFDITRSILYNVYMVWDTTIYNQLTECVGFLHQTLNKTENKP